MTNKKSRGGAARWVGLSASERSEQMRRVAETRAKLTPERVEALGWITENREKLLALIQMGPDLAAVLPQLQRMKSDAEALFPTVLQPPPFVADWPEDASPCVTGVDPAPVPRETLEPEPQPETAAPGASERALELSQAAADGLNLDAARCSVCLSVLLDLDAPCPTCVASGRLGATIPDSAADQIAELQRAHDQQPDAPPPLPVFDVPRISNALKAQPIPAPEPARAYSPAETCRNCGRLAELHQSHGGPIGHSFEKQETA